MSANRYKTITLDLDELTQDLISLYLNKLGTQLNDVSGAIKGADLYKIAGRGPATLADIDAGGYFDANGKLVKDLPITDPTKLKRLTNAMSYYCDNKNMTDKEKFILFCANFTAASDISGDKLSIGLIPYQSQPEVCNKAKQIFEELQFHLVRAVSRAEPNKYQEELTALAKDESLRGNLTKLTHADSEFIIKLAPITKELSDNKQKQISKRAKEFEKSFFSKEKEEPLNVRMRKAEESLNKDEPRNAKYKVIAEALSAIEKYKQDREFTGLSDTAKHLCEMNLTRAKTGLFNEKYKHGVTDLTQKFAGLISGEQELRVNKAVPASPTEIRGSSRSRSDSVDSERKEDSKSGFRLE